MQKYIQNILFVKPYELVKINMYMAQIKPCKTRQLFYKCVEK